MPVHPNSPWKIEGLEERVIAMWLSREFSASEIANEIGHGLTRSAISGRMHRAGIEGGVTIRERGERRQRSRVEEVAKRAAARAEKLAKAKLVEEARLEAARKARVAEAERLEAVRASLKLAPVFEHVPERACMWPVGEVDGAHRFCGGAAVGRGSYCAEHGAAAVRPTPKMPNLSRYADAGYTRGRAMW